MTKPKLNDLNGGDARYKIDNTLYLCYKELRQFDIKFLVKFSEYLLERIKVILIKCEDVNMAMTLFETINTRGLDLNLADLFKNYLFKMTKENNDEEVKLVENKWNKFLSIANDTETEVNEIILLYSDYLTKETGKNIYQLITKTIKDKNLTIVSLLLDLEKFVDNYKDICDSNTKLINSLKHLDNRFWKTIILSTMMQENLTKEQIERITYLTFKSFYIVWVDNNISGKYREITFKIIKELTNNCNVDEIENIFNNYIEKYKDSFLNKLLDEDIYKEKWCAPILSVIEYFYTDNKNPSFIEFGKTNNIEHIMPQTIVNNWNIEEKVHKRYVNSFANLMILGGKKNKISANKCFDEKMKIYENGNLLTYKTSVEISKKEFDNYKFNEWNETTLEKRIEWFKKQINKIFGLNIDNNIDNINIDNNENNKLIIIDINATDTNYIQNTYNNKNYDIDKVSFNGEEISGDNQIDFYVGIIIKIYELDRDNFKSKILNNKKYETILSFDEKKFNKSAELIKVGDFYFNKVKDLQNKINDIKNIIKDLDLNSNKQIKIEFFFKKK
jgi:hypothetical protein